MLKVVSSIGGGVGGVTYKGTWNASANSPPLASGVGTQGNYYVVNVAGSTNLDGITDWQIGDWAIFNGTVWEKVDNTDAVTSVNGQVGVGAAANTVNVIAGTGLGGGGNLEANVTLSLANTTVTADTYGSANTAVIITVDAQGRLTNASNATIAVTNSQVSGLGTMSTQNANNVAITGGVVVASNVTVTANLFANLATSNTAAMPDPSLPLNPEGYLSVVINGSTKKIPFYGV
jgi:hypothetical protein